MLNIREQPNTASDIVAEIPPDGRGIEIHGCRRVEGYRFKWCRVTYRGKSGWASGGYLVDEKSGQRP